jgi:hypothetical protein
MQNILFFCCSCPKICLDLLWKMEIVRSLVVNFNALFSLSSFQCYGEAFKRVVD